jgi:hypothetical protein
MGSANQSNTFDPLDLEIIDRVYEVGCAYIEARDLYCEPVNAGQREEALRKVVFASAGTGPVDFDRLCDKVLAHMAKTKRRTAGAE